MAITRLGSTFLSNYGNGARTLAVPGSYAAGDLILAVSFTNAAEGGPTVNGDSRFTRIALAETLVGDSTTSNNRGAIWYAFATSASEADVTFPDESPVQAVGLITYSGVDSVALISQLEGADMPNSTTLKWGGGTVTSGSTIFGIGVKRHDVATSTWAGDPSGTNYTHTAIIDQNSSNRNNGMAHMAFDGSASSATLGDLTATVLEGPTGTTQGSALIQLVEASGGGGVTGTMAATEGGSDTAAFTGSVAWPDLTGTMAATEGGSDTASASGTVTWPGLTGSLSATEAGADTASFSGVVTDPGIVGFMAVAESGSDTASVSGTVVWPARTGSMAATESGSDTASGSGDVIVSGSLAATETGGDTAAFAGIVTDPGIVGSLAAQEAGSDTASGSGTVVWPARTGSLAATESGSDTASFSGIVTDPGIVGSMAATESGSDTASASGTVAWAGRTGSLAAQEVGSDTASIAGGVAIGGAMAVTEVGQDVFAGYEAALSGRREREASASDPRGLIMLNSNTGSVNRRNGVGSKGSVGQRRPGTVGAGRQ